MPVQRTGDVNDFLARSSAFLERHEAENNLIFGITSTIRQTPDLFGMPPRLAIATDDNGEIRAAALQTPPYNLVLSWMDELEAADELADAFIDDPLPGLLAPTAAGERFVTRWTTRHGRSATIALRERIFRLERLVPPERPASGTWRLAEPRDREIVARWIVAFHDEATPDMPPIADPLGAADRWIERAARLAYVWEDGGELVSFAGAGGETPNGARIGPVYTPPAKRGRGYASSLTAAATRDQLERGRRFMFLFTDLANPTSNKIYQALGYEPVCDVHQYRFDEPDTSAEDKDA